MPSNPIQPPSGPPVLPASPPASEGDGQAILLAGLRARDPRAFEQFVRVHTPALWAAARRLVKTDQDAEDCVQESLVAIWKSIDGFDGRSSLLTWARRIATNAALMHLRRRRARPELALDDLAPAFADDGHFARRQFDLAGPEPREGLDDPDSVREALDSLSDDHRTVLILRDVEGMEAKEVAEMLGGTDGAVRQRLHRARQALIEALQRRKENP